MTDPHPLASNLLPLLAAAFPHTFFADPKQVQPLQLNLHRDLYAALPADLSSRQVQRFLWWYVNRPVYQRALAEGRGRIDLSGAVVDNDIPEPIRARARQELARRQHLQPRTVGARPVATANPPAAALLSRLVAAFPQTFFTDPQQVRPLKAFLYRDLLQLAKAGTLPADIDPTSLKPFLRWYRGRTAYLRALARGAGRIDLTGTVVTPDIPEVVRQRAGEEVLRRWQQQAARSASPADTAPPPAPPSVPRTASPAAHPTTTINPEELYAMAVDAQLELTLKFSTLPGAKSIGQGKTAFALKTSDGQFVTAEISNKVWNKLVKANTDWPQWVAALSGTMGERTEQGFTLATPGLQVFERKAKAAEAPAPAVSEPAPVPAPAPPPLTAPVTVITGAGPATVTVTKRAPLGLKRNAST